MNFSNRGNRTSGERAGNRTQDFLLKRQVLYRLSYTLNHVENYRKESAKSTAKTR